MIDERYVGDTVVLKTTIKDALTDGLVDPTDLVLKIFHKETGVTTEIQKASLTSSSIGEWSYDFDPPYAGTYIYSFAGTGVNKGIDYEAFVVKRNPITGV